MVFWTIQNLVGHLDQLLDEFVVATLLRLRDQLKNLAKLRHRKIIPCLALPDCALPCRARPVRVMLGGNIMARLSTRARKALPASAFAGPDRSYPIADKSHARNALARASQFASPALKAKIKSKVKRRYPSIAVSGKANVLGR